MRRLVYPGPIQEPECHLPEFGHSRAQLRAIGAVVCASEDSYNHPVRVVIYGMAPRSKEAIGRSETWVKKHGPKKQVYLH